VPVIVGRINRYLIHEISKPFVIILVILSVLFSSYSAATFLSDAVNGLLPSDTVLKLIVLKGLISLEVLIPISLYIAVVVALGRLYSESEIAAMSALTVSPLRIASAISTFAALLALFVAALSLLARPWAYDQLHQFSADAEAMINFDDMEAGTFYADKHERWLIFIGNRSGPGAPASDVLIKSRIGEHTQTIYAQRAFALGPVSGAAPTQRIRLERAHVYQIADAKGAPDQVSVAEEMIFTLGALRGDAPSYSAVAASSSLLARSKDPADIAEFEWRLSTPLSTLLLGLLAIPLSRTRPRQGKYARMGVAIGAYAGYYLLCTAARIWVQRGQLGPLPGLLGVPAALALILAIEALTPTLRGRRS